MRLGDALKGLFRRADTGATGGQPVADAPEAVGATSVPANPEGTPPAEGVEMNMGNPNVGEAGPASVPPDLGPESPAVSEPATELKVPVTSATTPEAEEPKPSAETESPAPPSLSETEAE